MTRKLALAGLILLATTLSALAQSGCSYIRQGAVLTPAQWNECFADKNDLLTYTPVNRAGDTMTGRLGTISSTTTRAGFNVPHGTAPTSPVNGDIWTTTSGLFVRINGATVGPFFSSALADGRIFVGNASNIATAVALSGDATLANTGAITVTKTNGVAFGYFATGTDAANLTGTVAAARMPALTGDVTTTVGTVATTLATVNSNVGTFGSATQSVTITVNGKGLVTAASHATITPAVGSISGLGTGIATALGINVGSAGAPVLFNGAGGTPTSLALANATGLPLASGISGTLPAANGGFGANISASSGVPLFASGTATFTSTTGTGVFVRQTSPTIAGTPVFSGLTGIGTECMTLDASGSTGRTSCSGGGGFPVGGVKGDLPYYSAASTGAATKASDANILAQGASPAAGSDTQSFAALAYGYSKRIILPPAPGGTTAAYKFSTNTTFPVGTELHVPCGVVMQVDDGVTVRNNGVTKAGQCQIVTKTGTTGIAYLGRDVRPDWWPSTGGDDTLAINAADASTVDAASQGADGTEAIIRLSCKTYTAKTAIVLHASSTNQQNMDGCGDSTIIDPSSGSFARGVLTQNGQPAGVGADLMSFRWSNFAINCSADQNVQGITLGTTTNAIRSYTKNVIERVRVSNCRIGIGWYNTRLVDLVDMFISVRGDLTSTAAAIQMDFDDTSQFNGDSDILRGQFQCADATHAGGNGYGLRMKSDVAGSNISGIRMTGAVFYYCNKMVYGTWSSTGTMGDHFFMDGLQCEQCGNIADYQGSTGTKKAAMLRFINIYVTAPSGRAQPYFRFAGGNADEIVDIALANIRIRGGGGCAACRFISFEFSTIANVTNNQLVSFEGSGSNPNELIKLTSSRKIVVSGTTVDADGISGAVNNLVTADSGATTNDITVTGNNARSAITNTWVNTVGAANVCVASNLPSAAAGC